MVKNQNIYPGKAQTIRTYLISITGIVQGVGFRPFIWITAEKLKFSGNVANTTSGVIIKVNSGDETHILNFIDYIRKNKPAAAFIENTDYRQIPFEEFDGFRIEKSYSIENTFTLVSPDIATCSKCIEDISDPENKRRFNYPFTNCTNCGPRFTIIEKMPYDRPSTTMKKFVQCPECLAEYTDQSNRRFHAQPNACNICGPVIKLTDNKGKVLKTSDPVDYAANLLMQGFIVGIKSLGGFQIACDATNKSVVAELRKRKSRPAKPFALMFKNISFISRFYYLSEPEIKSLSSSAAPIVLLRKKYLQNTASINESNIIDGEILPETTLGISFNNKYEGVMLPYTPLHHLLFKNIDIPLVMTSGNISEEPIEYKNNNAASRLGNICDYFLTNDRDIFSRYDDSVIKIFENKEMILRRARGYAPYPLKTDIDIGSTVILAVGAQEKNTFCILTGNYAIASQHIGDLDDAISDDFFRQALKNYKKIFGIKKIDIVIADKHPDYISTKFAKEFFKSSKIIQIQHHEAHIASVIAENKLFEYSIQKNSLDADHSNTKCEQNINIIQQSPISLKHSRKNPADNELILGFAWDGTGYGHDEKIWGSEIFLVDRAFTFKRIGSLSEKYLPGGEISIKKPYRMALSYLYDIWEKNLFKIDTSPNFSDYIFENFSFYKDITSLNEISILKSQLQAGFNSPKTTSMGRFFDAVSSILNISHITTYEGQAAIELEMAADLDSCLEYDLQYLKNTGFYENLPFLLDANHILMQILEDLKNNTPAKIISAKFHNSLAKSILLISLGIRKKYNIKKIALSGGVFQNNTLIAKSFSLLKKHGFEAYSNFKVPVNDGGISLGQAYYAAWKYNRNN